MKSPGATSADKQGRNTDADTQPVWGRCSEMQVFKMISAATNDFLSFIQHALQSG